MGRCFERDKSSLWGEVFSKGMGFIVGEGSRVHFGFDDWLGGGPFFERYPSFPRLVKISRESVVLCPGVFPLGEVCISPRRWSMCLC